MARCAPECTWRRSFPSGEGGLAELAVYHLGRSRLPLTATLDLSITDRAPATAGRMASAALDFLASLNETQRRAATLPFGDDRRYVWDYRPPESTPRNGLRLINMTHDQQRRALAVLDIGLSARGAEQV